MCRCRFSCVFFCLLCDGGNPYLMPRTYHLSALFGGGDLVSSRVQTSRRSGPARSPKGEGVARRGDVSQDRGDYLRSSCNVRCARDTFVFGCGELVSRRQRDLISLGHTLGILEPRRVAAMAPRCGDPAERFLFRSRNFRSCFFLGRRLRNL